MVLEATKGKVGDAAMKQSNLSRHAVYWSTLSKSESASQFHECSIMYIPLGESSSTAEDSQGPYPFMRILVYISGAARVRIRSCIGDRRAVSYLSQTNFSQTNGNR